MGSMMRNATLRLMAAATKIERDVRLLELTNEEYESLARAVLQALLAPTPGMKMAGAEAITAEHMKAMANYDAADDAWQAMIRSAMEGE